jgi:predicted tellurium resistance membrane protein TerC
MYRELSRPRGKGHAAADAGGKPMSFSAAVGQIILADVSMSLDNVLAVAGVAKGSTWVLVIGLAIAIVLMAVAANYIAGLLARYPWITWIGLLIIVYVAVDMVYDGSREVACAAGGGRWCAPDLMGLLRALFTG